MAKVTAKPKQTTQAAKRAPVTSVPIGFCIEAKSKRTKSGPKA